jgi:hypothetical protein
MLRCDIDAHAPARARPRVDIASHAIERSLSLSIASPQS